MCVPFTQTVAQPEASSTYCHRSSLATSSLTILKAWLAGQKCIGWLGRCLGRGNGSATVSHACILYRARSRGSRNPRRFQGTSSPRVEIGLVFSAYGGKLVWSFLLTGPRPEIGFGLSCLRSPPPGIWICSAYGSPAASQKDDRKQKQGQEKNSNKPNLLWPKMAHLGPPFDPKNPLKKSSCGSLFCVLSHMSKKFMCSFGPLKQASTVSERDATIENLGKVTT